MRQGSCFTRFYGRGVVGEFSRLEASRHTKRLTVRCKYKAAWGASYQRCQAIHVTLRFFAPGLVWVFVYRRFGLAPTLIAHLVTHIFLQPLLGVALA